MAQKPLRPCRHPGCRSLTREGWCAKHKPKQAPRRESAAWHGWYSLPVWTDDLRPGQLLREPTQRQGEILHRFRCLEYYRTHHFIP